MKRIIYLLLAMSLTIMSCEDIMDRKPLDKISDDVVWDNPVMLRAYLTDVYARMPFNNMLGNARLDTKTDIATTNKGNQDAITQGLMSKTSDPIAWWDYAAIRAVNVFIDRIGSSTVLQSTKDQLEGEARVLRAMMYYEMQRRYGGVPLVDVPLDPFSEVDKKYTVRSTEEAIADFIDQELTRAVELLKDVENPKPLGQINKWTAYAFKARANLWSASIAKFGGGTQIDGLVGIPAARANEFYTKASNAANAVINSEKYTLFAVHPNKSENYRLLFITNDNNETIFAKRYDGVFIGHTWNEYNLPQSIAGGRGSWDNPLYDYMVACEKIEGGWDPPQIGPEHLYAKASDVVADRDPRIRAVAFFDGEVYEGMTIRSYEALDPNVTPTGQGLLSTWEADYNGVPHVGADSRAFPFDDKSTRSGFMVKKFCQGLGRGLNSNDWMEFRLGEMYLIRAEAEFELGNLENAAAALNKTRERAGISLVDATTITQKHVRTERMSELAWEQHRWWDLRRWRIAEETLNTRRMQGLKIIRHYPTDQIYFMPMVAEPFDRTFLPQHYYNPITDGRITTNTDLIENPGY
jgi:starch-binding outer membrane protein, SusD/RagB family